MTLTQRTALAKGTPVLDFQKYRPVSDQLVIIARCVVDNEPGAAEDLGLAVAEIGLDISVTVGVYAALISLVGTAELQVRALASRGEYVHESLLEPVGDAGVDHCLALMTRTVTAALSSGPNSPESLEAAESLLSFYHALESFPKVAGAGLLPLALHLVMHERVRGIDLLTSID